MTRTEYNRTVDHFSDGVYRFILKMCKSKEMAEDVVQDSFMKLWEEVEYIAYDKAKSFLFSTAYHRMIDVLRRETKFGDIENGGVRGGEGEGGAREPTGGGGGLFFPPPRGVCPPGGPLPPPRHDGVGTDGAG